MLERLLIGTLGGLLLGIALLVVGAIRILVALTSGVQIEDAGSGVWSELGLYLAGATASGMLAGLLSPMGTSLGGAITGGIIAAVPFMSAASVIADDQWSGAFSNVDLLVVAMMSAVFGSIAGIMYWRELRKSSGGQEEPDPPRA